MSSALLSVPSTVFPPTPTSGPDLIPRPTAFNLSKRADHIPSNFCGWFSGSGYDQRWTYNDPSVTCFWNSDAHFVGNAIPPQTACIGEAQWSTWSCSGSGCSSSVARCTGTQPYCVTFSYGLDYLSFVCSEKEGVEYQMEPYWSGFSDPIAFPVYTGSNGVSTGTQYPAGYATPSSTTSSSSSTSTTSNSASGTSQGTSGSSASSNPSDHHGNSAPIGAIVGGVIGGLAFISLIAGVIIFVLLRRRRRPQPQQPAPGFPQGPHPANLAINTGLLSNPTVQTIPPPGQGRPQSPPAQQPPRHEIETQYNKPELDTTRQQPKQTYLNQQAELQGMQPIQPEYVSMAQQPSKAELASHSTRHQGKEGNIYEAP